MSSSGLLQCGVDLTDGGAGNFDFAKVGGKIVGLTCAPTLNCTTTITVPVIGGVANPPCWASAFADTQVDVMLTGFQLGRSGSTTHRVRRTQVELTVDGGLTPDPLNPYQGGIDINVAFGMPNDNVFSDEVGLDVDFEVLFSKGQRTKLFSVQTAGSSVLSDTVTATYAVDAGPTTWVVRGLAVSGFDVSLAADGGFTRNFLFNVQSPASVAANGVSGNTTVKWTTYDGPTAYNVSASIRAVGVAGWPSEVQVRLPQTDSTSPTDIDKVERDTSAVVPIPKRLYLCGLQRVSFEHSYFLTLPPVFPLPANGAGALFAGRDSMECDWISPAIGWRWSWFLFLGQVRNLSDPPWGPPYLPSALPAGSSTPDHYRGSSTLVGTGLQKP